MFPYDIRVLIPYFGRWPDWMPFFLRSCSENSSIRWIFYTDCGMPYRCPKNVLIREVSFHQYCMMVSEILGIRFQPRASYKLCDLRPALAEIHQSELAGATHWAYGDIDVVIGPLEKYLQTRDLKNRDVISMHARRLSGHLTIFRNTIDLNSAFRKRPEWKRIMEDPAHRAFDERDFSKVFLRHKNSPVFVQRLAKAVDPWLLRADFCEAFTTPNARIAWLNGTLHFPKRWFWRDGKLWNDSGDERIYPYFHFMNWKKSWGALGPFDEDAVWSPGSRWVISEAGIEVE